jgi:AcrR family transcriptional regulator
MSALTEHEADRSRRRDAILDAAYRRFSHFGYDRTSLADIAAEATAPTSEVHYFFRDKDDVFRAVSLRLHEQALAAAQTARAPGIPLPDALRAALRAAVTLALPAAGPRANSRELLDPNNGICGDVCRAFARQYLALVTEVFAAADARGELNLAARQLSAADAASVATAAVAGIVASHSDWGATHRLIEQFVTVLVVGLAH